ncbi:helix-turn-helix domain-containing protein [Kitasatospora aureofaciens]|uniref:TetR/AcrR family transcriptional regulator n=1 Tax=Kitasatospora aureofaciens TaxID=1894 RepID=UPI000526F508|nr:TetR/AcrR family transcriptional regulator [Kitasatospora aureofaciens]HJD82247.1 TetR/AcrR family transcriptional regulator [Kitasatospora aureofaciens]
MAQSSANPPGRLRRDAQRNRDLLLAAAREMFSRHGLDVPLDQIAKEAGVGNATLYRNFPTREALVAEVFADAGAGLAAAGQEALAAEDAWTGLERYFDRIFELVAADRGINDLVTRAIPTVPGMTEISRGHAATVGALIARAQEQGSMRRDVVTMDLLFLLGPLCRALPAATELRPDLWRRYLALLLDGFRARATHPLPVPPVGEEHLDRMFADLWEAQAPEA